MKFYLNTVLIFLSLLFGMDSAVAQDYMNQLKDKSFTEFSTHFDDPIQLEIRRNKQTVSKDRAISLIKERLNQLNPVRWEMVHKGESEERKGLYMVLKAFNDQEEGVRIFIHMKQVEGKRKISSIRFRKLL